MAAVKAFVLWFVTLAVLASWVAFGWYVVAHPVPVG